MRVGGVLEGEGRAAAGAAAINLGLKSVNSWHQVLLVVEGSECHRGQNACEFSRGWHSQQGRSPCCLPCITKLPGSVQLALHVVHNFLQGAQKRGDAVFKATQFSLSWPDPGGGQLRQGPHLCRRQVPTWYRSSPARGSLLPSLRKKTTSPAENGRQGCSAGWVPPERNMRLPTDKHNATCKGAQHARFKHLN